MVLIGDLARNPQERVVSGDCVLSPGFSAELEGGVQPESLRFSFELRGSEGWLRLTSNSSFGFQAGHVQLTSNVAFKEPEATAVPSRTVETAINVGEVYAQLARDLHDGAYRTPGFDHALANARLIEAVRAAEWGERRKPETRTDRNAR